MANRNWLSQKQFSMHAMPVHISATAQIGAVGAVSSFVGACVSNFARVSIGRYRITMQADCVFPKLLCAQGSMQSASGGLSGIVAIEIQNAPNASVSSAVSPNGGVIDIRCLDAAGALADPASGSAINMSMIFSNSSVVIGGE